MRQLFRALDPSGALFRPVSGAASAPPEARAILESWASDDSGHGREGYALEDGPVIRALLQDAPLIAAPPSTPIVASGVESARVLRRAPSQSPPRAQLNSSTGSGFVEDEPSLAYSLPDAPTPLHREMCATVEALVAAEAMDADVAAIVCRRGARLARLVDVIATDPRVRPGAGTAAASAVVLQDSDVMALVERLRVPQLATPGAAAAALARATQLVTRVRGAPRAPSPALPPHVLAVFVVELARELFARYGCLHESLGDDGGAGAGSFDGVSETGGRVTPSDARLSLSLLLDALVPLESRPPRVPVHLSPRRLGQLNRSRARLREIRERQVRGSSGGGGGGVGGDNRGRDAEAGASSRRRRAPAPDDAHAAVLVQQQQPLQQRDAAAAGMARALGPLVFTAIMDPAAVAAARTHSAALGAIFRGYATHAGKARGSSVAHGARLRQLTLLTHADGCGGLRSGPRGDARCATRGGMGT